MSEQALADLPLSTVTREASRELHDRAEATRFIAAFVDGRLPRDGYVSLLAQLWFVYEPLERAAEVMRADPVAGAFVIDDLRRASALQADLAYLLGPDWRPQIEPVASTARYRHRLLDVAFSDPPAFVAHHYARYLGDISGGQFLRVAARRAYGFEDGNGASFYHFPASLQPGRLRVRYRRQLDESAWNAYDRDRFVTEVVTAFRLNVDLLDELGSTTG
jgi:heme oxygenase